MAARVLLLLVACAGSEKVYLGGTAGLRQCDLTKDLAHLNSRAADYPWQRRRGPMQADEMLLLFSVVRTSSVRRILEIGGLSGFSAFNFLEALRSGPMRQCSYFTFGA